MEPQCIAQDDLLAVHLLQDLCVDHILTDHPRDPERRRNHQAPHAIVFGSRIPTLPMEASLSGQSSNCKLMTVENNNARRTMPPHPGSPTCSSRRGRDNSGIVSGGRTGTVEPDAGGGLDLTITEQFARSMSLDDALNPRNLLCYEAPANRVLTPNQIYAVTKDRQRFLSTRRPGSPMAGRR